MSKLFKISGQERRNLKKLVHEYKSYEKGFWHYHQLDKDMCAFVTPTGGLQKDTKAYPMSDEDAQKRYDKLLSDIDLIIMNTQDFGGVGYIAVEALSVGIPVISTKVGAANEILKDTAAKLINPGDINELKNKIIDIHKNYDDYAKEAYAGKKIIERKYNSNIMSENFYNILNLSLNG